LNNTNWHKLDNVAKVFLAVHNKRDTRSLRVSATLYEKVNPIMLQTALDRTVKECPQFQVRIRRGLFWHYMEGTDAKPVVTEENERPCPILYGEQYRGILHYKVSYYHNRINLDMFHAITDGTGAMEFLDNIVFNYLKIAHPNDFEGLNFGKGSSLEQRVEDSFSQFSEQGKSTGSLPKSKNSYQISEKFLPFEQLQFFEIHLPAKKILAQAKSHSVSLGSYLGSQLMIAISKTMPARLRFKPITISMPVNLRNYYPSETARNFFNSVRVSHVFSGEEDLDEICSMFDKQLKENLTPDRIRETMNNFQQIEYNYFVKAVPLIIKQPVVKFFSKRENKNVTLVFSNLGPKRMPEQIEKYVESYCGFCSTPSVFITAGTYKEDLVLGVSSAFAKTAYLKELLKALECDENEVTVYATEVVR